MFIDAFSNNGQKYLRLMHSNRVTNNKGIKVARKSLVLSLGPLSRYDDGQPNFLERLRQSFKIGEPLIPALLPYCTKEAPRAKYKFVYDEGNPNCFGETKLYSHKFLERILEEIGLKDFFHSYKSFTKIEYDVYGFAKLLIFGRLLCPQSKIATVRQNDDYYDPILTGFNKDNVYDTLDFIAENKDKIIRRMNTNLVKKAGRRPEIIYYDVTNFYYEIEDPDEDELDGDGNIVTYGLRKFGVSKENRKQPIVQMGLFLDDNGIPIAIEEFPGNTLDHLTLRTALKNNIDGANLSRFIMIGDRGVCAYPNLLHLLDTGNGYIVAKSLQKGSAKDREWAYAEDGYAHENNSFKFKSRIVSRKVSDEHGIVRTISEKEVVYWSENFACRQQKENKSFLEFLEKLIQSPTTFRANATHSKTLRKFLKKELLNEQTGEVLDGGKLVAMLDMDKVNAFRKDMGYYLIVTSELELPDREVIDKYHGLSRIEDQFRVMKSDLNTRPLFVRNPDRIKAHLLVCLIALIMLRIIQNRIVDSGLLPKIDQKLNWTSGLSAERIQKALRKWQLNKMPDDYFQFLNLNDPDLKLILDAFNIRIQPKFYQRNDLKALKTETKIFK